MLLVRLAVEASAPEAGLVQWIPLFVGLFVLAASLWTSWWATRGETATLRQLKLINEVISGTPPDSDARVLLENARNLLATRIAANASQAPFWRDRGLSMVANAFFLTALVIITWDTLLTHTNLDQLDSFFASLTVAAAVVLLVEWLKLLRVRRSRRKQ